MQSKVSKADLIADIVKVANSWGGWPSLLEYRREGGKYSSKPFRRAFGSWGKAVLSAGGVVQKGGAVALSYTDLPVEIYDKYLHVVADKVIVAFDTHIPYHSVPMLNEMLAVAKDRGIKTLVIGGDVIDFKSLYTKEVQTTKIDWTEEITEACKVLEALCGQFDKVYCIKGNHDNRWTRLLGSDDRVSRLYNLIFKNPKIKFSPYQFLNINNDWQVLHSGNSKAKLSKLEKIVNITRKSTIAGHSHRWGICIHDSGKEVLCEGLHLTDPLLHEYKSVVKSDFSEWVQGFWILEDNKVYPYVKHELVGSTLSNNGRAYVKKKKAATTGL